MRTSTETLIAAMRILSQDIQSDDGVANAVIAEAGERLAEQHMRINRLEDCLETAWGIISNVSGGDWTLQKHEWQEAVVRWRDNQFRPIMKELSERRAKENK